MANRIDNEVAEKNPSTAHMFFINPLHAHKHDRLFATHPNTENRIAALESMEPLIEPSRSIPKVGSTKRNKNRAVSNPWKRN